MGKLLTANLVELRTPITIGNCEYKRIETVYNYDIVNAYKAYNIIIHPAWIEIELTSYNCMFVPMSNVISFELNEGGTQVMKKLKENYEG